MHSFVDELGWAIESCKASNGWSGVFASFKLDDWLDCVQRCTFSWAAIQNTEFLFFSFSVSLRSFATCIIWTNEHRESSLIVDQIRVNPKKWNQSLLRNAMCHYLNNQVSRCAFLWSVSLTNESMTISECAKNDFSIVCNLAFCAVGYAKSSYRVLPTNETLHPGSFSLKTSFIEREHFCRLQHAFVECAHLDRHGCSHVDLFEWMTCWCQIKNNPEKERNECD